MEITGKHITAAICLVRGMTRQQAAIAADVTPVTVTNWQKEPDFIALMRDLRRDLIRQASGMLTNSLRTYLLEIEEIGMAPSDDPDIKPQHKLSALFKLVDLSINTHNQAELALHIEELEHELRELKKAT
ncbi:MAG: hypothetical protein LRZ84_14745 [Desertifilum sp.]|nr:hypothetical protein [Desertifilum sp.]